MPDGTDNSNTETNENVPALPEPEYPVDRLKARVGGVLAGKPLAVYLVLIAGAATLIILLVIVWFSATGGTNVTRPICTTISAADARTAVLNGHVQRIWVLVDADKPAETLTGINLDLDDGSCRATIQGADHRDELYLVLGAVTYYNNYAENRVSIQFQKQTIQPELLSTSTETPTATKPPTETETATSSPVAAETATTAPTETATLGPIKGPENPATPTASETQVVTPAEKETATATSIPHPSPTHEPTKQPGA